MQVRCDAPKVGSRLAERPEPGGQLRAVLRTEGRLPVLVYRSRLVENSVSRMFKPDNERAAERGRSRKMTRSRYTVSRYQSAIADAVVAANDCLPILKLAGRRRFTGTLDKRGASVRMGPF